MGLHDIVGVGLVKFPPLFGLNEIDSFFSLFLTTSLIGSPLYSGNF